MKVERTLPVSLAQLIDESRWTAFHTLVLCLVSLAFIVDSLANNVLAIAIPAMMKDWHVTRADFSSVTAIGWVGVAFGSVIAGSLADKVGRKTMLLISILIFGLATAFGAAVANIHQLLILRAIDGFGIGGAIPTATTLLAEFTPVRRRSRALIVGMICMPTGTLLGGVIGSTVLPSLGWRSLFAINGSMAILICVLLLTFVPESPQFLVRKPSRRNALLRGLRQFKIDVPAGAHLVDSSGSRQSAPLSALFGRGSLGATLALWGGFFFCFLASYTSLNWLPSLLSSHGYGLRVTSLALSASGFGGIFASVITAKLIELFGSRKALLFPTLAAILGAGLLFRMPLDPAQSAIPVLLAISILGLSLNSLTNFVYVLGAFIYPPFVKGTGLGAAGTMGRIGAISSSYAAVAALAIGSQAYFGFIAAAALIAVSFLIVIKTHIPSDKTFDAARL